MRIPTYSVTRRIRSPSRSQMKQYSFSLQPAAKCAAAIGEFHDHRVAVAMHLVQANFQTIGEQPVLARQKVANQPVSLPPFEGIAGLAPFNLFGEVPRDSGEVALFEQPLGGFGKPALFSAPASSHCGSLLRVSKLPQDLITHTKRDRLGSSPTARRLRRKPTPCCTAHARTNEALRLCTTKKVFGRDRGGRNRTAKPARFGGEERRMTSDRGHPRHRRCACKK